MVLSLQSNRINELLAPHTTALMDAIEVGDLAAQSLWSLYLMFAHTNGDPAIGSLVELLLADWIREHPTEADDGKGD